MKDCLWLAEIFGESRGTPNFDQSTTFFQPVWIRDLATNAFRFTRLETGPGSEGSVCTPSRGRIRAERVKTLMVGHGGCSAGSYLADPTSPIPSHCAVIILFTSVPVHQLSWLALHTCVCTSTFILMLQVEQFILSSPHEDASWKLFDEMIENAENYCQLLGLPYRVVNIVSGWWGFIVSWFNALIVCR